MTYFYAQFSTLIEGGFNVNGGYIMLDCTGLDLTKGDTPQTLVGMFNRVKQAMETNKPMYCVNANWDNAYCSPIQIFAIEFDGYIIVTASTLQVTVTDEDVITISSMVG